MQTISSVLVATVIAVALGFGSAEASVLASNTAGSATGVGQEWGQSVTTVSGGPFDDIQFNFYDANGAPTAAGTLYVFSSIYSGTPAGLASAGALAASVSNAGGIYSFAPSLTLNGGQQYFFYEDTAMTTLGEALDNYPGGNAFYCCGLGADFTNATGQDANFLLAGDPIGAVPEPISLSIFGAGLLGGAVLRRRKAKA